MKVKICIMLAFLSVLLLLPINVRAADFGDINVTIPAEMNDTPLPYYCIWAHYDETYLMLSSERQYFSGPSHQICIGSGASYVFYIRRDDGSWELVTAKKNIGEQWRINFTTYHHSNYDLKRKEDDKVVFQKAPIKVSLNVIMNRMAMGAMMKTVVSLIPLLMVLVTSLMAFRKAWSWLLKVLHKA